MESLRTVSQVSESGDGSESEDMELLPTGKRVAEKMLFHSKRHAAVVAFSLSALACFIGVLSMNSPRSVQTLKPAPSKVFTVRSLLESSECTDAMTDNIISLSQGLISPTQRGEVRAGVAANIMNMSHYLRENAPAEHRRLGETQLSEPQRAAVLGLLRHYADPRIQHLNNDIHAAVHQTLAKGGDRSSLEHRLIVKLQPRLTEVRQLYQEVMPGMARNSTFDVDDLDLDSLEAVKHFDDVRKDYSRWNLHITMSRPEGGSGSPRQLTAEDTLDFTQGQTITLFDHLNGVLGGEEAPTAPARRLFFEKAKREREAFGKTGKERFFKCIMIFMKALPSFEWKGLVQCIAKYLPNLWSWISTKFLAITGKPLTVPQ